MENEPICTCSFRDQCVAAGALPSESTNRAEFGCDGQTDGYRETHCRAFGSLYLSAVFAEVLAEMPEWFRRSA